MSSEIRERAIDKETYTKKIHLLDMRFCQAGHALRCLAGSMCVYVRSHSTLEPGRFPAVGYGTKLLYGLSYLEANGAHITLHDALSIKIQGRLRLGYMARYASSERHAQGQSVAFPS